MTFGLEVSGLFEIGSLTFSAEQMRTLAEAQMASQKERIANGQNVNDAPARKLNKGYATEKLRRGLPPIRDMKLSGRTLAALDVTEAVPNNATVAFNDPTAARKAHACSAIDEQFGVSPKDAEAVMQVAAEQFPDVVKASIQQK